MDNTEWKWPDLNKVFSAVKIPAEYEPAVIAQIELPDLIAKLSQWFPEISTGHESVHFNESFYIQNGFLAGSTQHEKNLLPVIFKHQNEIVLLVTFEKNPLNRNLTARVGAIAPEHRGMKLAFVGPALLEELGRQMKAGVIYYSATLKTPHQQIVAEKMGFTLAGIMPAYGLETVSEGVIKRTYKAIYTKVLADASEIDLPKLEALTSATQQLFNMIYGRTIFKSS